MLQVLLHGTMLFLRIKETNVFGDVVLANWFAVVSAIE